MMSYINETDFVIENKELVYPEIVTDGLQLYYDAKGKRDTDYHRDTMLDMSGNKNHGNLYNFAYEKNSGYKDGLVFDYIDDKLVRPTLDLQPDDFTFMLNGNIISFSPDGTVKRVQDGEVIESKGFNLVRNGDFVDDTTGWASINSISTVSQNIISNTGNGGSSSPLISQLAPVLNLASKYYVRSKVRVTSTGVSNIRLVIDGSTGGTETYASVSNPIAHNWYDLSAILTPNTDFTGNLDVKIRHLYPDSATTYGKTLQAKYVLVIDLTATFGAGNEPTKEQMDEIINRFGFIPNTQDLISRIEYRGNDLGDMENIIDGLYKTEDLSGEEIYTDKADDAVVHVGIDGKSVGGGNGKNLFNSYLESGTIRAEDGTNLALSSRARNITPTKVMGSTDYVYRLPSGYAINRVYYYNNGTYLGNEAFDSNSRNLKTPVNANELRYSFMKSDNSTIITSDMEKIEFGFQIEEGTTATTYEPPAPTPDYPIEIHSLNDFDVVSSVGRSNIYTGSRDIDHRIDINNYTIATRLPVGKYTISFDYDVIEENMPIVNFLLYSSTAGSFSNVPMKTDSNSIASRTFTVTDNISKGDIWLYAGRGSAESRVNHVVFKDVKIEKGSTATPYSPALEDVSENDNHPLIDKINILLDEPLRSVGDVKDRLFRDSGGLWKVERNVGEYKFIGTETLTINTSYPKDGYFLAWYSMYNSVLTYRHVWSSSHFLSVSNVWDRAMVGATVQEDKGNAQAIYWMRVPSTIATDLSSLKGWLKSENDKGTPVSFQYDLTNSKIETLPKSDQDKLNNLHSFEDSNYVYTVLPNEDNYLSDNLKPTLHAKFLYNNWYKEDRVINNLMIYNRALTNEEMLQNYKTIKRRWVM